MSQHNNFSTIKQKIPSKLFYLTDKKFLQNLRII
jgi:hypothetical protein